MHSPSVQLLRSMRASITLPEKALSRQTRLGRFSVSRSWMPCIPPFPCAITPGSATYSTASGENSNDKPIQRIRRPPTHRRSELSTADLKPKSRYRGPTPPEDPQTNTSMRTDLGALDVFANAATPATAIDACLDDGFHLDSGVKITDGSGCLLVDGEVFTWRPWETCKNGERVAMVNERGQWDVGEDAWGVLSMMWPKPDLLILGLGASVRPISPETRRRINQLGIRVDIQDTRNAAAQFNLLATERGVREVAAALIPIGWRA